MELGNLIFGNSRGNFEIPREEAWENPMFDLQEKILEGCSPYGTPFENDVFTMRLYDWDAQCTCGYEEIEDKWTDKNAHSKECYQTKLGEVQGKWLSENPEPLYVADNSAPWNLWYEAKREFDTETYDKLCAEFNVDRQYGAAVHCTCDYEERLQELWEHNDHTTDCRLVQPNFFYKPNGFSLMLYKYALRDSYANRAISLEEWQKMLKHCEESVE